MPKQLKAAPWQEWVDKIHSNPEKFNLHSKEEQEVAIDQAIAYRMNSYIPIWPNVLQFGIMQAISTYLQTIAAGESRASKTYGVLAEIVRWTNVEDFKAICFRSTIDELAGLRDTLSSWLLRHKEWSYTVEDRVFRNSLYNSTIQLSYMDKKADLRQLFGFQWQRALFEELTRFNFVETGGADDWNGYFTVARSLNAPLGYPVEPRLIATSNPGGQSEAWVIKHFLSPRGRRVELGHNGSYLVIHDPKRVRNPDRPGQWLEDGGRCYIHAMRKDNDTGLDQDQYTRSMLILRDRDPTTYAQLAEGKWGVTEPGGVFHVEQIRRVYTAPSTVVARHRGWDKAGTILGDGPQSAGVRIARITPGLARALWGETYYLIEYIIEHGIAGRWIADTREEVIDLIAGGLGHRDNAGKLSTARVAGLLNWPGDPYGTAIDHEQEPGSGGKESAEATTRRLIRMGFIVGAEKVTGDKETRARQFASACNAGMVAILDDGSWPVAAYLAELNGFPKMALKDFADASSLAFNKLLLTAPALPPQAGKPREIRDPYAPAGRRIDYTRDARGIWRPR